MSSTIFDAVDEAARRRFENAWKDGRPLPIEDCLPAADHPHFSATLEELVIIDMEMAGGNRTGGNRPGSRTTSHAFRAWTGRRWCSA